MLQALIQTYLFHAIIGAVLFTVITLIGREKSDKNIGLVVVSPILGAIVFCATAYLISKITTIPPSSDIVGWIIPIVVTAFVAILLTYGLDDVEEETKLSVKT